MLSILLGVLTTQVYAVYQGLRFRIAEGNGTPSDTLKASVRRRQNIAGAIGLVLLLILFIVCYRTNYWPGVTPHHRAQGAYRTHSFGASDLPAALRWIATLPAWLVVLSTAPFLTIFGATGTNIFLVLRKQKQIPPRYALKAIAWPAVAFALSVFPVSLGSLLAIFWLSVQSGEAIMPDPPSWAVALCFSYFAIFVFLGGIVAWRRSILKSFEFSLSSPVV